MTRFDPHGGRPATPGGFHAVPGTGVPLLDPQPAGRSQAMRRRLLVFFGVFLLLAAASLAYVFLRPPVYLANARVQVTPSTGGLSVAAPASAVAPGGAQDFLLELQVLSSRPLLEKVVQRMATGAGGTAAGPADGVQALQDMLAFRPVAGTNVVVIEARGPDRLAVARLVNTVVEVYREEQAATGDSTQEQQLAEARETLRVMDTKVAARKRAVEEFRVRSAILSAERDENQTLARLKGMGESVAKNDARLADAEGRVKAMEQALAEGRRAPQSSQANPTLAAMEKRLSEWQEEYRALERRFTPQYLDMDPNAKALKVRIAELGQQTEAERAKGQQNALAEAREELAAARAAARQLQQQSSSDRQNAETFTRRFGEFKAMEEELRGLEQMRQAAHQRMLGLEATVGERKPRTLVVEPAAVPDSAWRPLYARDAGIALAGSLALGFLAVWFVEFFDRQEPLVPAPSTVIMTPPAWGAPYPMGPALGADPAMPALGHPGMPAPASPPSTMLLARGLPRELEQHEVAALLAAAAPEQLFVLLCLLSGLCVDEVCSLRVGDLDKAGGQLKVPGDSARNLPLEGPLAALTADGGAATSDDMPLLPALNGRALTAEDIASAVTSAAFDAGLPQPQTITPESLRHTYLAFLVRQGLRFGDLNRVAGTLPAELLNALSVLAPAGERLPLAQVQRVMPAVAAL